MDPYGRLCVFKTHKMPGLVLNIPCTMDMVATENSVQYQELCNWIKLKVGIHFVIYDWVELNLLKRLFKHPIR